MLTPTWCRLCACVCEEEEEEEIIAARALCVHTSVCEPLCSDMLALLSPGRADWIIDGREGFFFSFSNTYACVCLCFLIHLRDAVWSVYPSREVLFAWTCKQTHRCRCFTVSAPRYDSPLFHLPPLASVTLIKITQLCARRREPDDTIAHMQKAPSPFFSSISLRSLYLIDFLLSMAVL